MKTKLNFLAAGIFLATVMAGHSQPVILTQPQNHTNAVGTTATFWVVATGTEPLAHQWQKFSVSWSDLAGCTDTNLCLTNLQTSHAGDYRVVITNADGAATSEVATLTVLVPPAITPTITLQHRAVHVGTSASFAVTATGTGPLSYQWRLDDQDLADQTNATINFSPAQPADEGDYTVVVTNVAGAVTSAPARLWVVPPPSAYIRGDYTNGTFRYPYYYLMPTNYNPDRSYPLVCFYHGGCGDEITFTNGDPDCSWLGYANSAGNKAFASYRQQATDPAIVLWPTRRAGGSSWDQSYVYQTTNLLDDFIARFNIDTNRLYVAGMSQGFPAAWDLLSLRPGFFAGGMLLAGSAGSARASAIKDVPLWVCCALDDEFGFAGSIQAEVNSLRRAGGNPLYTQYKSGGHVDGIRMGMSTPAVVDWLLAQRRGVAPTNGPLLVITNPTAQAVLFTGATNLNLAGWAGALGDAVTNVTWWNTANNNKGDTAGTNLWSVTGIPLVASKTNVVVVTGTTTSWAPAFGGTTTFNDTLTVIQSPIQVTLTLQGTEALLDWTGGRPPYTVQRATDLAIGDWTVYLPDATPPVPLPLTGQAGFYRILGQ